MEKITALEDAIEKKSLVGIYSVFYTIAHGDPSFSTNKFHETLQYVKSKGIGGFMQEFDGEEFEPEDKWDEDYWAFVASSLIDNFCEERINHLEQVGRKVYPARPPRPQAVSDDEKTGKQHIPGREDSEGRRGKSAHQGAGLISDEKKQRVREEHADRRQKNGGGFLSQIFKPRG